MLITFRSSEAAVPSLVVIMVTYYGEVKEA
jgi:hypothetical protein